MGSTAGVYFARREHGGHRVIGTPTGFRVVWPDGAVMYPSARQTIMALVNGTKTPHTKARDPHLTFDRYFRIGRHARRSYPAIDTLDLFHPSSPLSVWVQDTTSPISVAVTPTLVKTPSPAISIQAPPGVDLDNRGHEVRKLFYAGFSRRVYRYGYDPEDVLQEIYKGILIRNMGKCPFDPSKSSFGHYVHMVCGCIVSNYHRRYSRLRRNEVFGVRGHDDEVLDVAEADLAIEDPIQEEGVFMVSATQNLTYRVRQYAVQHGMDAEMVVECTELLAKGQRRSEIATHLGRSNSQVGRILKVVRDIAGEWREEVLCS